ncbi:aldose 1-epimerase [Pseudactinotalea suaedae]|uniref:aldose 1-epimerase n=1 Tax=Pseudactinotalea suaedae TaxID=1524924 RepID=UPI00139101E5|nr:aldose 1-epimerase [Pseudactinotalea suaedae]
MNGQAAEVREVTVEGGWPALEMVTAGARVQLIPELGCDIVSFVDARTEVDVLWRVPWGIPPRSTGPFSAPTETEWGERFPGGWNVLCPNAGAATPAPGGTTWGFHGEAALLPWTVIGTGVEGERVWAELEVGLIRAPLRLHRRLELIGSALAVTETLTNLAPVPIEVMWSQHPSFGAPLVAAGTRIETGAGVTETDDTIADGDLAAGQRSTWPHAPAQDGSAVDLSRIPDFPTHRLVYLSEFETGWARLVNDAIGLAARLEWDTSVYPSAWLWQELGDTPGHPWWKRAYVCAIEPGTTYPGQGLEVAKTKGGTPLRLAGGETRTVTVGLSTEAP